MRWAAHHRSAEEISGDRVGPHARAYSRISKKVSRGSSLVLSGGSRSRRSHEENPSLSDSAGRLPPETLRWAETTSATARVVPAERDGESTRRENSSHISPLYPSPRNRTTCAPLSCAMHPIRSVFRVRFAPRLQFLIRCTREALYSCANASTRVAACSTPGAYLTAHPVRRFISIHYWFKFSTNYCAGRYNCMYC